MSSMTTLKIAAGLEGTGAGPESWSVHEIGADGRFAKAVEITLSR